jgi:hypothetical protein
MRILLIGIILIALTSSCVKGKTSNSGNFSSEAKPIWAQLRCNENRNSRSVLLGPHEGKLLWRRNSEAQSILNIVIASDGTIVYSASSGLGRDDRDYISAIEVDGSTADTEYQDYSGIHSIALLSDNRLIALSNLSIYCISTTGHLEWEYSFRSDIENSKLVDLSSKTGHAINLSPIYISNDNDVVFCVSSSKYAYVVDQNGIMIGKLRCSSECFPTPTSVNTLGNIDFVILEEDPLSEAVVMKLMTPTCDVVQSMSITISPKYLYLWCLCSDRNTIYIKIKMVFLSMILI